MLVHGYGIEIPYDNQTIEDKLILIDLHEKRLLKRQNPWMQMN